MRECLHTQDSGHTETAQYVIANYTTAHFKDTQIKYPSNRHGLPRRFPHVILRGKRRIVRQILSTSSKEGSRNIYQRTCRMFTSIHFLPSSRSQAHQHTASRARRYQACRRPQPTCAMQACLTCMRCAGLAAKRQSQPIAV